MVINNIYMFGIRGEGKSATHRAMEFMKQKRFNAKLVHTHTFDLKDLPTALKYARERIDDAIKIVISLGVKFLITLNFLENWIRLLLLNWFLQLYL